MIDFVRAIYWILVGFWLAIEAALLFDKKDGGAMPMAFMLAVLLGIGGFLVFLLAHILISKMEKDQK